MRALLLLLCFFLSVSFSYSALIKATTVEGFDTIFLDYPAFVTEFHFNGALNKFYAYGDRTFRQIDHAGQFAAVDNETLIEFDHPFIDVRLFSKGPSDLDLWAIGPTYPAGGRTSLTTGYSLPLSVIGPGRGNQKSQAPPYRGETFFAVSVDARQFNHVLAYFVGWAHGNFSHSTYEDLHFVVVRAHVDLTVSRYDWNLTWDYNKDVVSLYTNDYQPFHPTFRPRIIHDFVNNKIFVIDPASNAVYKVNAPPDNVTPLTTEGRPIEFFAHGRLAGSTWHYYQDILYVGFAANGIGNGSLVSYNLVTMQELRSFVFPLHYSNPRAIAGNTTLFVGFEGGPGVIAFDPVAWRIKGHARLPTYLHTVYTAWDAGYDHVYFATHEQHTKIFRLHKENFCSSECPFNGFCEKGGCKCIDGYEISGAECKVTQLTKDEKAAAVALGILFAIAVVLAGVGWFMFYRARSGGSYQRVL